MKLEDLFQVVADRAASDLLISAGAPPTIRINGELVPCACGQLSPVQTKKLVYECLTAEQQKSFESRKELDLSVSRTNGVRYRVNCYEQKGAVAAAFRPIPDRVPSFEELGLPEGIEDIVKARMGLVLVTGPAGHGKTTTQAAVIDCINKTRACHIITVEDPIEYVHYHGKSIVDQREVGGDTHSFNDALNHILRQDPDVILIGEMRDLETIQAAIRAAETGHLVLATLHTNDAVQTVDRVIDVFPAGQQQQVRFQLAMCLLSTISQRLIPRADGTGRVLACEFLRANQAVANLIRESKSHLIYGLMETGTKSGMLTLDRSIKELYLEGLITYEEAAAHAKNPKDLGNL